MPRAPLCLGLAGLCHADELTDRAIRALQANDASPKVTIQGDDELHLLRGNGKESTVYLDNLRKRCASIPAECEAMTAEFAKRSTASLFGANGDDKVFKFALDKIYPVLRHAGYASQAGRITREPTKAVVMQPFAADVELLFVIDGADAFRYVTVDELKDAGLTLPALLARGSANATRLPPLKPVPITRIEGLSALMYTDSLGCVRMFDAAMWDRIEKEAGGPVAVAVPTRDWILFVRLDDPARVKNLHVLARNIAAGEAYGVSDTVFRRNGTGWVAIDGQ